MTPLPRTDPAPQVSTGYWAGFRDPAGRGRHPFRSRVHSHVDGRPLCGYRPSDKAGFHFCSATRAYAVNCPRCLTLLKESS